MTNKFSIFIQSTTSAVRRNYCKAKASSGLQCVVLFAAIVPAVAMVVAACLGFAFVLMAIPSFVLWLIWNHALVALGAPKISFWVAFGLFWALTIVGRALFSGRK